MKKFYLAIMAVVFVSVLPAHSLKLIVNNPADMTVPSRSTGIQEEEIYDDTQDSYKDLSYKHSKYYNYDTRLLSQDIRKELIGTTWYYINSGDKKAKEHKKQIKTTYVKPKISREAADYQIKNIYKPSGK